MPPKSFGILYMKYPENNLIADKLRMSLHILVKMTSLQHHGMKEKIIGDINQLIKSNFWVCFWHNILNVVKSIKNKFIDYSFDDVIRQN